jgi:adenosylmethionine-8-amino-7-oxononanoate aminotransferase
MTDGFIRSDETAVFPRELDRAYPLIERAEGVWLYGADGKRYLDAAGGGAMVSSLGNGVEEIVEAAREQARRISFAYNQQFTSRPQEDLARAVVALAPGDFARVHFTSGGAEANEAAVRLARAYHVDRGERQRWRIVSPAQAYHGPTALALGLTGRPHLTHPYDPYVVPQLHVPPATSRFDPTGEEALAALDRALAEHGDEIAAFFCEPVSAAALPAYSPPDAFWHGLAERRDEYGFLVVFDEVVTGLGRTGTWFAAEQLPIVPDIITTAKGLGAGYAPVAAVLCRAHVYEAIASGSRLFDLGHTWNGSPLPCAVGLAVIAYLKSHRLVERVRERGAALRAELEAALADCDTVREVRGRGFLLGVEYADPRDGESFLDRSLAFARRIDMNALERGLIVYSTQPTPDGYTGDQTLLAPAFTATDEELDLVVARMAETVKATEAELRASLPTRPSETVKAASGGGFDG